MALSSGGNLYIGQFPSPGSVGGRALAEIASKHGATPRQMALNFLTRHPGVFTIPKADSPEPAKENSGGAGWSLAKEDLASIDRAFPAPDRDVPLATI